MVHPLWSTASAGMRALQSTDSSQRRNRSEIERPTDDRVSSDETIVRKSLMFWITKIQRLQQRAHYRSVGKADTVQTPLDKASLGVPKTAFLSCPTVTQFYNGRQTKDCSLVIHSKKSERQTSLAESRPPTHHTNEMRVTTCPPTPILTHNTTNTRC